MVLIAERKASWIPPLSREPETPAGAIRITSDFRKNGLARKVPDSFFADSAWWLPPDPDPESARYALRFFPSLATTEPELVAAARMSACDFTPIDYATPRWDRLYLGGRPLSQDPWQRITTQLAQARDAWHPPLRAPIELHPFQRIDADYFIEGLETGKGAYAGHEMGLGKTLLACMVADGWNANFILIACPNNAKQDPWAQELARFCPWIKPLVVGNTRPSRFAALDEAEERMNAGEPTALIVHYQAIPLIEKMGAKTVSGWRRFGRWDLFISDEAHLYKKRTAQFTSACRRIDAVGRLNLSGSVMSGKAEEMFVPWQMFQPKVYRSQHRDWNKRYMEVVEDDYGHDIIVGPAIHKLPAFRAELGKVLTIRLAKDHLSIPEANVLVRNLTMHPEQAAVYRTIADDLMAELPDGDIMYATDGAPLRSALRLITAGVPQIAPCPDPDCTGAMPSGGFCARGWHGTSPPLLSAKHDAAMEDIISAGDSQVVMFGWHRKTAAELQRRCHAAGISCGLVSGDIPVPRREREVDLFKRGGYRVLAATIKTLSSAANLQNASAVLLLEESDDPVDNEQAIGRVVRQGQMAHATVYTYRIEHSVDDLSVAANAMSKAELRRLVLGAVS